MIRTTFIARGSAGTGLAAKSAVVSSSLFVVLGLFSMSLVLPQMSAAFANQPQSWMVEWVGSIVAPSFAIASPMAGILVDRVGYRPIYAGSILLFVACGLIPFLSTYLALILAGRVILGIATAGALTAGLKGIGSFPAHMRATLFGFQGMVGGISAVLIFPVVGFLSHWGWQAPYVVHALGLLVLPLVLRLPQQHEPIDERSTHRDRNRSGLLGGLNVSLCLFAATVGLLLFISNLVTPFYLISIGIRQAALASIPLTAAAIAAILGAAAYGYLHRRLLTAGVFSAAALLTGAGLMMAGASANLPMFTTGTFLMGCGLSICSANLNTAAVQANPTESGKALGAIVGAMYFAPILLPLLVGPLETHFGAGAPFLAFTPLVVGWAVWFGLKWRSQVNAVPADL